jgi:DNA-binding IclR family transcriptional regulator
MQAAPRHGRRNDPLFVQSVEKAFRVLTAFDATRPTLNLSQLTAATGLDKSAAQRFAHTLLRLGYLRKDPHTKHFELTTRTLAPAYHYTQSNPLVRRAVPYLVQLSSMTEEAANLSVLEGTEIVFVARFISRHVVTSQATVGMRSPAYCTAPGIAMLSHLPTAEVLPILAASKLRAYTPYTTWRMPELLARLEQAATRGYAICSEEMLINDVSVAAPILYGDGRPIGAVNLAVSKVRWDAAEAERRFAPLVVSIAQAISG